MATTPSSSVPDLVTFQRQADVLVVTIDNPPVNALGVDVRRGLVAAIDAAEADAAVAAVLIVGAGRNFIAGADIREFGKPPQPPSLPEVCSRIENCSKPVVAAIHGAALGGGLEIALSAHYRLAVPSAKLGLPEVQLGLMPGLGRHAARAAPDRREGRARTDAERPPRRREGSAGARPDRPPGRRRRRARRRPGLCAGTRRGQGAGAPHARCEPGAGRQGRPAAPRSKPRAPTPRRRAAASSRR